MRNGGRVETLALQTMGAPTAAEGGYAEEAPLLAALRRGDIPAFEELHRRLTPLLLAIARRYVGSRALAEDIVQDTWLAVTQGIGRFEGRSSLKTWIVRILHYRARSAASKEARSIVLSALGVGEDDPARPRHDHVRGATTQPVQLRVASPEDHAISAEIVALIAVALAGLPKTQRAVVVLHDVEGWPAAEVCARLNLSAGNQRVLLHRARQQMRRELSSYLQQSL
jgi:RNA polymerase sigma-70 factor (ECF subfamily)